LKPFIKTLVKAALGFQPWDASNDGQELDLWLTLTSLGSLISI